MYVLKLYFEMSGWRANTETNAIINQRVVAASLAEMPWRNNVNVQHSAHISYTAAHVIILHTLDDDKFETYMREGEDAWHSRTHATKARVYVKCYLCTCTRICAILLALYIIVNTRANAFESRL